MSINPTPSVTPIPEHLHTVTPRLVVGDGVAAIAFHRDAFGAQEIGERFTAPSGEVIHAEGTHRRLGRNDHRGDSGCRGVGQSAPLSGRSSQRSHGHLLGGREPCMGARPCCGRRGGVARDDEILFTSDDKNSPGW